MRRIPFVLALLLLPLPALAQQDPITAGAESIANAMQTDQRMAIEHLVGQIQQDQQWIAQLQAQHSADVKALADAKKAVGPVKDTGKK